MAQQAQFDCSQLVRLLLLEGFKIWVGEKIPVVGGLLALQDRVRMAATLEGFFRQSRDHQARITALEALAATPRPELERLIQEQAQALLQPVAPETRQFVTELVAQLPQAAACKTTLTLALQNQPATAESADFYQDLIPIRRPRDWAGQTLPHRSVGDARLRLA